MLTDILPVAPVRRPAEVPGGAEPSLTWRASLNLVQSILDYSAKLGVGLVVIPILVASLGRGVFGVWEMLGRLMGYLESADGRPTQALRLVISSRQSQPDPTEKRRWIGSALVVWACFLPLWITAGALLIWLAPSITKVEPQLQATVRITCGILMAGLLLGGLTSLPESVLRGMNLGYKRMGLQAGLSVLGGALLVGAVYLGTGIVGLAIAGVLLIGCTGLCFLILVRQQVPWFGAERPSRPQVTSLLQMSLWIAVGDSVSKLLLASDVLILGMVLSPAVVTTYVLTGYAPLLAVNLHSLAADSMIPGLAGIIGDKRYARAALLRRELLAATILFVAATGSAVLLWNRSFVGLWVGSENYAGAWTNVLLVVIAAQTAFIRCDAYIIDAALRPGSRVRVSAVAALVAITLSIVLTRYFGIAGLCLGIIMGRSLQTIGYPLLVRECLQRPLQPSRSWLLRPLCTTGVLFGLSAYAGEHLLARHWLAWFLGVLLTFGFATAVTLRWGLPGEIRLSLLARAGELAGRVARGWGRSSTP
jgi:O-antigen/teichoic acid export membrane protein